MGDRRVRILTTEQYAAEQGLTPRRVRDLCRDGKLLAQRVGAERSEWRVLVSEPISLEDDHSPAATGDALPGWAGLDAEMASPDVMSPGDPFDVALDVTRAVRPLSTRPARALVPAVKALALIALAHTPDPDGRCLECRAPMFPCRTARYAATLHDVGAIVLDGAP